MTKKIITLIGGILLTINLFAQKSEQIRVPRINSSSYFIIQDSNKISFITAEKVALKLEMEKYYEGIYSKSYKRNSGFLGVYTTAFVAKPITPKIKSNIKLFKERIELKPNERVYIYGFTSALGEGRKVDRNFSRMMMSAYMQEIDSAYLRNHDNFSILIEKTKAEYWKRNWINMGYGMSYIVKDNPFIGSKRFTVGFFYLWEALHYIPIFGGAFFGETQVDKIAIPVIGLTSLILWKGMIGAMVGNKQLKINKIIIKSGYKIPNNFEY
jgi:hypothetical protein